MFPRRAAALCPLALVGALGWPLHGQDLSGRQLGPLTLSGEASASLAAADTAFFNDTGYDVNPLRVLRVSVSAQLRIGARAAALAELVSEGHTRPRLHGGYLRLRPFPARAIDLQVGRIPPVFGSFARRRYGSANALIGTPLAYQYLTTLRPDAVADSADGLLRVRGRGWLVRHPVGDPALAPGLPLISSRVWDTGLELRLGREPVSLAAAVTRGTLAAPRFEDDNDGRQLSARLALAPRFGLELGLSAARGEYASRGLRAALPPDQALRVLRQAAWGFDGEYSWGRWQVRAEAIHSRFDLPALRAPQLREPVSATALSLEAVRRLAPGLSVAARLDRLGFGSVVGSSRTAPWDAPVTRLESGFGWQPWRPLTLKLVHQRNWRDEGPRGRRAFVAVQAQVRY